MGAGETKVDQEMVDRIKDALVEMKVNVDKQRVEAPPPGMLGQAATGESLKGQMDKATERINTTLSHLSDALIKFYDGVDRAAKEMTGADEEAGDYGKALNAGVALVSQPFFENIGKDDRPEAMPIPIPFLPVPSEVIQEMRSRAEIMGGDQ